ncbi:hypothetical protein [Spirillospora sp. NPDC047279]|uniref:hypothetical protein n=1 Tax=Spirillospora sp. NPDC047279 TaxID=3155478 RepID=UPI0033DBFB71
MRFLILLAAVALIAVVVVLLLYGLRGGAGEARPASRTARWEPASESADGVTTVIVHQVDAAGGELQRQVIAAIQDGDPEWEPRYHEAMAQARSRVAALESQAE